MADEQKVTWQVGDLCRRTSDNAFRGIIYRVIDVEHPPGTTVVLWIKPIYGFFTFTYANDARTSEVSATYVKQLSIIDLGIERAKFDDFLQQEAKRHGDG